MTLQPPIYHPGLEGVFAGISSICDVDPETGGLLYRGYSVEELSLQATFEELAYLLFIGRLPSRADLDAFAQRHNLVLVSIADIIQFRLLRES